MPRPRSARLAGRWLQPSALLLPLLACGGDGGGLGPPATGTLAISTSTTGAAPDLDGYVVRVDDGAPRAIGREDTLVVESLAAGAHLVSLGGVAANCRVAEGDSRSVHVPAGGTAEVAFFITCAEPTGKLTIQVATSGAATDPDGYTVVVDGAERGTLGLNDALTLEGLTPGAHVVGLSGIAASCTVEGDNPQSATITAGATTTAAFAVTCIDPPPSTGTVTVTTVTSGLEPDPDGYLFAVDGGARQPIGVSATVSLANVTAGVRRVHLVGVAANCTVQGLNPRDVTVPAGGVAEARFEVSCASTTGSISVSVTTSGASPDPDGYNVTVNGAEPGLAVPPAGTVLFSGVPPGLHTVRLVGVASNCKVERGPARTATVVAGDTAEVGFAVTCAAASGSLEISTTTSGSSPDPDGYTVAIDGGEARSIGLNATLVVPDLAPGTHSVTLAGIVDNCAVQGDNPRQVSVTAGGVATVAFVVTCASGPVTRWASIPLPSGFEAGALWASSPSDIFVAGGYAGSFDAVILHYDGVDWREQFRNDAGNVGAGAALWGASATEVFAVVGSHEVLRYDGVAWSDIGHQDYYSGYVAIWGTSGRDLFVGGWGEAIPEYGILKHYDGTEWSVMDGELFGTYGVVSDFSGTSPTDVYAVGEESSYDAEPDESYTTYAVVHYDGNTWRRSLEVVFHWDDSEDEYQLTGVWANASDDLFVVGTRGRILHYDGTAWSPMASPITGYLGDVWGSSRTNVYAVGQDGVLHYDGTAWTLVNSTPGQQIWGTATDVFVLGEGMILHGAR